MLNPTAALNINHGPPGAAEVFMGVEEAPGDGAIAATASEVHPDRLLLMRANVPKLSFRAATFELPSILWISGPMSVLNKPLGLI